ncbi:MAG: FkbM family methyltransferase [Planctomycetia bacterium]|nr:FkbM family methyltransferase [Planctomycetia bacterium]
MAPRWVGLKRFVASIIQSDLIGNAIAWFYGNVIPFHGIPVDVSQSGIPAANKAALWWGMYESAEHRFIKAFLLPSLPVIELGSSIGAISSVIAGRLDQGQRLTCVEANPSLIPQLRKNLDRNASHLSTEIIHAAVCYEGKTVRFGVSANNLTSSILGDARAETTTVPAVKLKALLAQGDRGPYQLVADIEGAEIAFLLHDAETLRACQVMVLELHHTQSNGAAYTPTDLEHLIESRGFRIAARYGAVVACQRLDAVTPKAGVRP